MAMFPVNPQRLGPFKSFKFRVKWDGAYAAAGSEVSVFKRTTEAVSHRDGGDMSTPHKSPVRTNCDAITFDRGLTRDMDSHNWAGLVWNYGAGIGSEVSVANFRKDLCLEAGQLVMARKIFRCWFSEYRALPDLDANANAIEHIKPENEGRERDSGVTEPAEPTLSSVAT